MLVYQRVTYIIDHNPINIHNHVHKRPVACWFCRPESQGPTKCDAHISRPWALPGVEKLRENRGKMDDQWFIWLWILWIWLIISLLNRWLRWLRWLWMINLWKNCHDSLVFLVIADEWWLINNLSLTRVIILCCLLLLNMASSCFHYGSSSSSLFLDNASWLHQDLFDPFFWGLTWLYL